MAPRNRRLLRSSRQQRTEEYESIGAIPDQKALKTKAIHYKTYLLHRINSTAKPSPYLSDYSRRSLRYFVQRKYHNHHCAEDLLLSKYEYLSNEVRRLGVNEKRLFERVPPSGIRLWMAWLKLRRSISNFLAALEERWENGRHVVERILRGLISGP